MCNLCEEKNDQADGRGKQTSLTESAENKRGTEKQRR